MCPIRRSVVPILFSTPDESIHHLHSANARTLNGQRVKLRIVVPETSTVSPLTHLFLFPRTEIPLIPSNELLQHSTYSRRTPPRRVRVVAMTQTTPLHQFTNLQRNGVDVVGTVDQHEIELVLCVKKASRCRASSSPATASGSFPEPTSDLPDTHFAEHRFTAFPSPVSPLNASTNAVVDAPSWATDLQRPPERPGRQYAVQHENVPHVHRRLWLFIASRVWASEVYGARIQASGPAPSPPFCLPHQSHSAFATREREHA